MIAKFKANIPYNNFLLLVYGLLLKWPLFLNPVKMEINERSGYLFLQISKWVRIQSLSIPFFTNLLYLILLFIQAIMLNKIAMNQRVFPKPNYLVGMGYLLCTSLFKEWLVLSPAFISLTILIYLLSKLANLYNNPEPKKILFNISFLLSLSALIYSPSILFFFIILIGLSITRSVNFREWIIVFIGLITPYYLLGAFLFLINEKSIHLFPFLSVQIPFIKLSKMELAGLLLLFLLIVFGLLKAIQQMRKLLVHSRKTWSLIFLFLMYATIVSFFTTPNNIQAFMMLATPIAFLLASTFFYINNIWLNRCFHWLLAGLAFAVHYYR